MEQTTDDRRAEGVQNRFADGPLCNPIQLTADIPQHTTGVSLQLFRSLTHAFKLPGMGVTPYLHGQARCETIVVLPQRDPAFVGEGDKLAACLLIQARIGRVGDVLFYRRRIHDDARQAAILHSS